MFDYRLAALLGFADIDEMKRSMTQRSYLGWQRYWEEEPWGPWRDNLHAAILARELRRTRARPGTKIDIEQFIVRHPRSRTAAGETRLIGGLRAIAVPVSPAEAAKRSRAARQRQNRGSRS